MDWEQQNKNSPFSLSQFPDQLEKIEQLKMRISRKKATIDARLKSSVQSQLDDVASCLDQLRRSVSFVCCSHLSWLSGLTFALCSASKDIAEIRARCVCVCWMDLQVVAGE